MIDDDTLVGAVLSDSRDKMAKAVRHTQEDFAGVRTGRPSPGLIQNLKIEYYGAETPLQQLAQIGVQERTLVVTPYDKGQAKVIEKAIRDSDLGLEPSNMGGVIRVPLPALNEQRRKELVKIVHKLAEEGRVAIRHARTDARDRLKKLEGVPEDDKKHAEKELQKLHDDYISKVEALLKAKEAEIMEV